MPCDQVRTMSVEFAKVDLDIMEPALKAAGYSVRRDSIILYFGKDGVSYILRDGRLSMQSYSRLDENAAANEVRRAYSTQVVKQSCSKYGWRVTETTSKIKGAKAFNVQKRA